MIIEYDKLTGLYAMDSRKFSVKGVSFEIIGTEVDRHDICMVTVRNNAKGLTNEVEHQRLCRIILHDQGKNQIEVETGTKNKQYRQTGMGI